MAAGNHRENAIKNNPDLFSDEIETTSEKILDALETEKIQRTISELSELPQVLEQQLQDIPENDILSVQDEIDTLLDKYYNGDRNVDSSQRFARRDEYKQELIFTLRRHGIEYVEKYHYPLSTDEKHIIRMDFYGTINRPQPSRLSHLYKTYCGTKNYNEEENTASTEKTKKRGRKKTEVHPVPVTANYPLNSYNLKTSPAWTLFRMFPRFHNLERRMIKTIQELGIHPEHLKLLSVYDFSDILYRTFRKSKECPDAHLFLGARQAFVKDVFLKHENWIRGFLERQDIPPHYINALIKSAQSKGVTGYLSAFSDLNSYLCEYAAAHTHNFQKFIYTNIKSDNYAADIQQQIQNNEYTIQGSAFNFLQSNRTDFENFIKKDIVEDMYIQTISRQFNRTPPVYVLKDIKKFILANKELLQEYLQQYDNPGIIENYFYKKLPYKLNPKYINILRGFIDEHQNDFFIALLENSRSPDYANFAIASLSQTPNFTDYGKELLASFLLDNNKILFKNLSPDLLDEVKTNGLNDETIEDIIPFISVHQKKLNTYFKEVNVLTAAELQNELRESISLEIQNSGISQDMDKIQKNFILSNSSLFKNWYIRYHTEQYKIRASETYRKIARHGITSGTDKISQDFLKERLNTFIEFAMMHDIPLPEIISTLRDGRLVDNPKLAQTAHNFITAHGETFKNYLLQNTLKTKERKSEETLNEIKQQGVLEKHLGLIHKFILEHQTMFLDCLVQNKPLNNQVQQTYSRITGNKSSPQEKEILKQYLNSNLYNYLLFQQDDSQLKPYVKEIADDVKKRQINPTAAHWLKAFITENKDDFQDFMRTHHPDMAENDNLFPNINFGTNGILIPVHDKMLCNIKLTVHHKQAIKDTGDKKMSMENIAAINNFSNLCIFVEFWHQVMHCLDNTESREDKERFVSRLRLADDDIIFFGGEKEEDRLRYDYQNDPRSKRHEKHLNNLISILAEKQNG